MTFEDDQSYRHSGRVGLAPLTFFFPGLAAIALLAAVYGVATVYNPLAGSVTIALVGAYTAGCGWVMNRILKLGRCRSRVLQAVAGIATGFFALWAAWFCFLVALELTLGDGFNILRFLNPIEMAATMLKLNETGWFSISGGTPSGPFLAIFWVLEALTIVVGSALLIGFGNTDQMFCERCRRWCRPHGTTRFKAPANFLTPSGKVRDARQLKNLQPAGEDQFPAILCEFLRCPDCGKGGNRYSLSLDGTTKPELLEPIMIANRIT